MEKEYVCKCNKCGSLLIDENPRHDTEKKAIVGSELSMVYLVDETESVNNETNYFWACPICLTDEYIMDI